MLRVVAESGPIEQTAIAKAACLLLPSLTRIMHAMEKDGLLQRTASTEDRRKSIVTITEKGLDLIREHAEESNAIYARLEAQFGKKEMDTLLDLLEKLQSTRF